MAFFKFRKTSEEGASVPVQPPTVESIRQRAKYRLAGATVLVLLGVVGFPILFDKQPRPIAVDTPISIPEKEKVLHLKMPVEPVSAAVVSAATPEQQPVASAPVVARAQEIITESAIAPKPDSKSDSKAVADALKSQKPASAPVVPSVKETAKAPKVAASSSAEAARVQSLLDGKVGEAKVAQTKASEPVAADAASRFVIQVGSFADDARAREVRLKLERAGLKTYAQVAETKDGKRVRVRVGPFATKAEASKVAEKVKKLSLPAALLSL